MIGTNEELEKAKRRIRALSEKTVERGASEAEAMLAMKKVGELLLQFNLSMDEVALREEPCVTKHYQTDSKQRDVLWYVYSGIRSLCGVKPWYERTPVGIKWSFFGLESDVDMALYLCRLITEAESTALRLFKKGPEYAAFPGHKSIASNNFSIGFGYRLCGRLTELADERKEAEKAAAAYHAEAMKDRALEASGEAYKARGTALICVAKDEYIESEFKKSGPKLRTVRSTTRARYNETARNAGKAAANRVNLNRPIEGGNKTSGLLR